VRGRCVVCVLSRCAGRGCCAVGAAVQERHGGERARG